MMRFNESKAEGRVFQKPPPPRSNQSDYMSTVISGGVLAGLVFKLRKARRAAAVRLRRPAPLVLPLEPHLALDVNVPFRARRTVEAAGARRSVAMALRQQVVGHAAELVGGDEVTAALVGGSLVLLHPAEDGVPARVWPRHTSDSHYQQLEGALLRGLRVDQLGDAQQKLLEEGVGQPPLRAPPADLPVGRLGHRLPVRAGRQVVLVEPEVEAEGDAVGLRHDELALDQLVVAVRDKGREEHGLVLRLQRQHALHLLAVRAALIFLLKLLLGFLQQGLELADPVPGNTQLLRQAGDGAFQPRLRFPRRLAVGVDLFLQGGLVRLEH
ncbi:threonine/serine dehydratase [Babesia caballi]|uniref:Threonine/serine dehydratase n=1 Tax=Babesia caballi TaxID=5871 RepID=A0AAV4LV44_BABCB|nr:threonine/serine dehydratase [Babesia caballi]